MSNKCDDLNNGVCRFWACPVTVEVCAYCKAIKGKAEGMAQMSVDIRFFQLAPVQKYKTEYKPEVVDIILKTCEACPHSTKGTIKAVDIKRLPLGLQKLEAVKKFVAFVGNILRKSRIYGLSCKLCGCDCKAKAVLVVHRLYSGGCLDIDPETKLSRWDAALKKAGL